MRKCAGLLIFLLVAMCGSAVFAGDNPFALRVFRSRHYVVNTDLEPKLAISIADHMDKVFDEYERRLASAGFGGSATPALPLYIVSSQEKYLKILGSMGFNGSGTAGMFFYSGDQARLAGWLSNNSVPELIETLQHEGFHQFAFLKIGHDLPTWVNEGLAVYFQQGLLIRNRYVLNQVDGFRAQRLKEAVKSGEYLPFDTLLNMSNAEWNRRVNTRDATASMLYDESWSIVHFLVNAERGRFEQPFMQYLRLLHEGIDSRRAFGKAFGSTDYAPFEEAWKKYIAEMKPDAISIGVQRARFLAEGMAKLAEMGVKAASLEQLKAAMKKIQFEYTVMIEDTITKFSASDDQNFQPPSDGKITSKWTLEASDDKTLPPGLSLTGLAAQIQITWSRDAGKNPTYELELR